MRPSPTNFFFLYSVLSFMTGSCAFCQLPDVNFQVIDSKDGLPSNTVYSAIRDKKGFMWFGTRLCPVRYDGSSFLSFREPETTFVNGIAVDDNDNIWFASSNSPVCKIDGVTKKVYPIDSTGDGGYFFIDSRQRGWYSDFKGVNRIDLVTGKVFRYPLPVAKFVWNKALFVEDKKNVVWVVGRDNGLFRYDEKEDTLICVFGRDCSTPDIEGRRIVFSSATVDKEGMLWMGTYEKGILRFDPKSNTFKTFATGSSSNAIWAVAATQDEQGKTILWVGSDHGFGVFWPDNERFYFYREIMPGKLEVNDIYPDPENGVVWLCTSKGIVKCIPKNSAIKNIIFPEEFGLFQADVKTVAKDKSQPLEEIYYLGLSYSGLVKWDRKRDLFSRIHLTEGAAEVNWIFQRTNGHLWVGTNRWDNVRPGIFVYDPLRKKLVSDPLLDLANTYYSVPFFHYGFFDKNGQLWIGNSDEGVRIFDPESLQEVTPWNTEDQMVLVGEDNIITDMLLTGESELLLAMKEGVVKADPKSGKLLEIDTSRFLQQYLSANSLLEDREQNIWTARWGALSQISRDGQILNLLKTKDGFYDTEIHGLAEDFQGNIWVGNWEGLYCYHKQSKQLLRFTTANGLIDNNTAKRIFISDDKRELFVLARNSFSVIDIETLLKPAPSVPLVIGSFKVHGEERGLDPKKKIVLGPKDNSFSIDFVSPDFRKPVEVYSYYLSGIEETWGPESPNHLAYYTNLPPGDYTLHLKAIGSRGAGDPELAISIKVLPAFYETWWFKIAVVALISGLLYGLYRYRLNQLLRMQRVRNRISSDLHDELGASLSGIGIMGALAQQTTPEEHPASPFLFRIVDEVQQISGSLDDIVWNISPKNDALSSMVARMTRYSSELFEAKHIQYKFSFPDAMENLKLSMEKRRHFYLIFKEAVNNLVKYSRCSLATIEIGVVKKRLNLRISDDGIGFDPEKQSDRNGLRNMRERSEKLRGKLTIDSTPGDGTTILLEFKIKE